MERKSQATRPARPNDTAGSATRPWGVAEQGPGAERPRASGPGAGPASGEQSLPRGSGEKPKTSCADRRGEIEAAGGRPEGRHVRREGAESRCAWSRGATGCSTPCPATLARKHCSEGKH